MRENFGILQLDHGNWTKAYDEFFGAFVSYSEVGSVSAAKRSLRYVGFFIFAFSFAFSFAYIASHHGFFFGTPDT
jgi:hypothetical protein